MNQNIIEVISINACSYANQALDQAYNAGYAPKWCIQDV